MGAAAGRLGRPDAAGAGARVVEANATPASRTPAMTRPARPARSNPSDRPGRRVHVVGIGGAGMSAIATVLAAMGHTVTGSDLKASPVIDRLRALGRRRGRRARGRQCRVTLPWSPCRRRSGDDNPEVVEAGRRGIPVYRRPSRAGGHRRAPPMHRGGRHPRQDDDRLDAGPDPGGGRASARRSSSGATSTRSGPTRCGTRATGWWWRPTRATGPFCRCGPTLPWSPTSSPTISTTTAPSRGCGRPSMPSSGRAVTGWWGATIPRRCPGPHAHGADTVGRGEAAAATG